MMNVEKQMQLWRLEAAARMARLPPARARHYVRLGLVRPARYDGTRALFGETELARLRRLRRLSDDLGLNLAGVEVTMRLLDEIARLRSLLERSDQSGRR